MKFIFVILMAFYSFGAHARTQDVQGAGSQAYSCPNGPVNCLFMKHYAKDSAETYAKSDAVSNCMSQGGSTNSQGRVTYSECEKHVCEAIATVLCNF